MRILVLADRPPWPLCYGGRLHGHELCRRLAVRHELLLLAQNPCEEGEHSFGFECRIAGRAWPAAGGRPETGHRKPETGRGESALPVGRIDRYFGIDAAFVREVLGCVEEWRPDVVIGMNYPSLAWLARIRGVPTICDLLDDGTLHAWRELYAGLSGQTWARMKSLAGIALFERRYLRRVTAVTVLSDVDARWCRRQAGGTRVECIPHGVDCDYFAPVQTASTDSGAVTEDASEIIFWGGLTFRPNIRAVLHFADRVWPLLQKARPDLRWTIVGWGCPPELDRVRCVPGIRFAGRVDDLRPHAARAALAVAPMVSGAGIKNKILEAWAMAKAVVCTPIALGSLPGTHGTNVWLARSPRELADGVLRLLADAPLRRRIGRAARATAIERCSWDRAARRLERLCEELVSPDAGRRADRGWNPAGGTVRRAGGNGPPAPPAAIGDAPLETNREPLAHAPA